MTTEDKIRRKLAARDALESRLRQADREVIELGRVFWQEQGLCSFPRVDALRRAVNFSDVERRETASRGV